MLSTSTGLAPRILVPPMDTDTHCVKVAAAHTVTHSCWLLSSSCAYRLTCCILTPPCSNSSCCQTTFIPVTAWELNTGCQVARRTCLCHPQAIWCLFGSLYSAVLALYCWVTGDGTQLHSHCYAWCSGQSARFFHTALIITQRKRECLVVLACRGSAAAWVQAMY